MDVIKTRLMAQGKAGSSSGQQYSSMLDALVKIPQQEGLTALWRGLLPRLMRIPPGQVGGWGPLGGWAHVEANPSGHPSRPKTTLKVF
jgi:hypothetical protein